MTRKLVPVTLEEFGRRAVQFDNAAVYEALKGVGVTVSDASLPKDDRTYYYVPEAEAVAEE